MNAPVGRARARERAALAALLALQLVLVLCAAHGRAFLDDEVGTWRAVRGSWRSLFTTFDEWQTQPAYFVCAKACALVLGPSELALRLPAIAAALGATAATFLLARKWLDPTSAFAAAALFALHPYTLFYAQMARGYSLAMALTTVSMLAAVRVGQGAQRWGPGWIAARALSVYAHLGAAASAPAEALAAWMGARERGRSARGALALFVWPLAGALLAGALYLPLWSGMQAFRARWTDAGAGGAAFGYLPLVALAYGGGGWPGMLTLAALLVAGAVRCARSAPRAGAVLALWCVGLPLFYAVLGTRHYPWAFPRFLSPALPALAIVAGHGLAGAVRALARTRRARVGGALAAGLVLALVCPDSARIAFGPRDEPLFVPFERAKAEGRAPETLFVLLPVRFQAYEPYAERIARTGYAALRFEELAARIARGEAPRLFARPVVYLADVAPLDALAGEPGATLERRNARTLFVPRLPSTDDAGQRTRAGLLATRAVARSFADFLEPYEGTAVRAPWVYWRLDARHEHVWDATASHAAALALSAACSRALGDAPAAASEEAQARALAERGRTPAAVPASLW